MKAIQLTALGAPDVLKLIDAPVPKPAADEVVVKVTATGVNYKDASMRRVVHHTIAAALHSRC